MSKRIKNDPHRFPSISFVNPCQSGVLPTSDDMLSYKGARFSEMRDRVFDNIHFAGKESYYASALTEVRGNIFAPAARALYLPELTGQWHETVPAAAGAKYPLEEIKHYTIIFAFAAREIYAPEFRGIIFCRNHMVYINAPLSEGWVGNDDWAWKYSNTDPKKIMNLYNRGKLSGISRPVITEQNLALYKQHML